MVSNEQAEQELHELIDTHSAFALLRETTDRLLAEGCATGDDVDAIKQSIVDFLKSDTALDNAIKKAGDDPLSTRPTIKPIVHPDP